MADAPLNLFQRLPEGGRLDDPDALLEILLEWSFDRGLELYPAQEEAILELLAGRHVVLNTPTGSGKSLVALAMHLRSLAMGRRSVYTSPIKALVSEKFFDLCGHFGAENVGMMTGDASINARAPIICCTAEILAQIGLAEGATARVHDACLDEFHYYADRDRGMAWQLPLLTLPQTTFLLMSATLGDTEPLRAALAERTGREAALVRATERPVPLEFSYSTEPLLDTLSELVEQDKAPVYVVSFTQKGCAELAQSLMSTNFCSKEHKARIKQALRGFAFSTPYGKTIQRFVKHGVGLHHAGLLPRYRLMVEQLAQQGLLKVICGTDTLGVGINIPLRTVLFSRLCKYDGRKTGILKVRDFQQIAGRAGRKGYDDVGWVVCQAPEHVIENLKIERKIEANPSKRKKLVRKSPPERGYAHWDEDTFRALIEDDPEPLRARFKLDHGLVLNLLQRPKAAQGPRGGYGDLLGLIETADLHEGKRAHLKREAARLFRALRGAGVVELTPRSGRRGRDAAVSADLQDDFSLHHTLSLFLLHALPGLDPDHEDYPLWVLTFVESILEDPRPVLYAQQDKARGARVAEMKAEGMDYDARVEEVEKVTWPMPDAERVLEHFDQYAHSRPWVSLDDIRPKSVVRDMYERYASFNEYVREFKLAASEGVLLRHVNQVYKTLLQAVPEGARTDELDELIAWVRTTLRRADSSLLKEWEKMLSGIEVPQEEIELPPEARPIDLARDEKARTARIRAEMHALVAALSRRDHVEAAERVKQDPDDPWDKDRFSAALEAFYAVYSKIRFDHQARQPKYTIIEAAGPKQWRVRQVLVDDEGDAMWYAEGHVDLRDGTPDPDEPLVTLTELRS